MGSQAEQGCGKCGGPLSVRARARGSDGSGTWRHCSGGEIDHAVARRRAVPRSALPAARRSGAISSRSASTSVINPGINSRNPAIRVAVRRRPPARRSSGCRPEPTRIRAIWLPPAWRKISAPANEPADQQRQRPEEADRRRHRDEGRQFRQRQHQQSVTAAILPHSSVFYPLEPTLALGASDRLMFLPEPRNAPNPAQTLWNGGGRQLT